MTSSVTTQEITEKLSTEELKKEIERIKFHGECSYFEAIVELCEERDIDILTVAKFIKLNENKDFLDKIRYDSIQRSLVKATSEDLDAIEILNNDIFGFNK